MELTLKTSPVYTSNYNALNDENIRFVINQGGSRSSKTYSICQLLIVTALTNPKITISVVRKSFPSLRGSVMRDLFEVMDNLGIYNENNHTKMENLYRFPNGSIIEFFSVDDAQKLRGRKRDILYINEANELDFEEYVQLNMRTSRKIFVDFNPSDNYSWIYDLIAQPNSTLIKSTYKDNPFLDENIIKEIENLINVDEAYWKVYGLGEQATLKNTIYSHYELGDYIEQADFYYGLDFGYNHVTALVEISPNENTIYVKEKVYLSSLTTSDLIQKFNDIGINKKKDMICDSARPDIIEELRRAGYNAKMANKEVKNGINSVKTYKIIVDKSSTNLIKELRNYKWKSNGEIILDEPVKLYDDGMDAMRYVIHWYKLKFSKGPSSFSFETFNM